MRAHCDTVSKHVGTHVKFSGVQSYACAYNNTKLGTQVYNTTSNLSIQELKVCKQ